MTGAACLRHAVGVSATLSRDILRVCTLSTHRHFEHKHASPAQNGPLIPCRRRLANMEISEIEEVTFGHRFGI